MRTRMRTGMRVMVTVLFGALLVVQWCLAEGEQGAKFIGNKKSKLYHRPDCMAGKRLKEENRVYFDSEADAKKAEFKPCRMCVVVHAKDGKFVASKNGKIYHSTDCPSANKLKDENKVYFKSEADAKKAGLSPCKKCACEDTAKQAKK